MGGMGWNSRILADFRVTSLRTPLSLELTWKHFCARIERGNQNHHQLTGSALKVIPVRLLGSVLAPSLSPSSRRSNFEPPDGIQSAREMETYSQSTSMPRPAGPKNA
jgi:hypothetical protein